MAELRLCPVVGTRQIGLLRAAKNVLPEKILAAQTHPFGPQGV